MSTVYFEVSRNFGQVVFSEVDNSFLEEFGDALEN
ncbi:hypothetical protein ES705_21108 [subsurface metagenome]